ncbi:hypothetical protein AKJ16_DCAP15798 [Drosera capensis]
MVVVMQRLVFSPFLKICNQKEGWVNKVTSGLHGEVDSSSRRAKVKSPFLAKVLLVTASMGLIAVLAGFDTRYLSIYLFIIAPCEQAAHCCI